VSRLQYTTEMRLIRVMCTGRVDLAHIFRAFSNGMDGVFIAGCRLNECNYVTQGNFQALNLVLLFKHILHQFGLNRERIRLEFLSSGEGIFFAEKVDDFVGQVKGLGPIGEGEGIDNNVLQLKFQAAIKLIPYLRLVESERLRVQFNTLEEYLAFYDSEEFSELFEELIADKLAISQITTLLRETPLSPGEIARTLALNPSEISRYLHGSIEKGLVRYAARDKRFALA